MSDPSSRPHVDWRSADLRGVNLSGVSLRNADLWAANLAGCNFTSSDLAYADFRGANVQGAIFQNANLYGAKMQGVEAQQADFGGAYLEGAMLPLPSAQRIPSHPLRRSSGNAASTGRPRDRRTARSTAKPARGTETRDGSGSLNSCVSTYAAIQTSACLPPRQSSLASLCVLD